MKVYKVWAKSYEYKEYDGFVVVAKCELDALSMVKHKFESYQVPDIHVDEVDLTKEAVIL